MKIDMAFVALILGILVIFNGPAGAAVQPPVEGEILPEILLPVPKSPEHQQYLGVSGKSSFTIPKIKAEVVIVEIFSMY